MPWSALTSERGQPAVWIIDPQSKLVALRGSRFALYRTGEVVIADGVKPADSWSTQGGSSCATASGYLGERAMTLTAGGCREAALIGALAVLARVRFPPPAQGNRRPPG